MISDFVAKKITQFLVKHHIWIYSNRVDSRRSNKDSKLLSFYPNRHTNVVEMAFFLLHGKLKHDDL
jgi:hypothetical protein